MVHFATHGILDATRPERSGLVLSLVDADGRPRDGVLRLNDIFGMSLSAELVVLSGCETGLGRQVRGEGLVGLTRAFMYAGAPRVVSSLWRVDDQATAQLMTRFYRHMLAGDSATGRSLAGGAARAGAGSAVGGAVFLGRVRPAWRLAVSCRPRCPAAPRDECRGRSPEQQVAHERRESAARTPVRAAAAANQV